MWIVVKNSPFSIEMALSATVKQGTVDLTKIAFDGTLCYDSDIPGTLLGKDVDFVKVKPMEFKVQSTNQTSQHVECEVRIKVLTSQHEGALFRIRIQGYNPITRQEIAGLTLISQPIKVISKPEPKKKSIPSSLPSSSTSNPKKRANPTTTTTSQTQPPQQQSLKQPQQTTATIGNNQASISITNFQQQHPSQQGDLLLELIQRIEKQQEEQQRILWQLLKQGTNPTTQQQQQLDFLNNNSTTTTTTTNTNETNEPQSKRQRLDMDPLNVKTTTTGQMPQQTNANVGLPLPTTSGLDDMFLLVTKEPFNFEEAFHHLIRSYILLNQEEKAEMIRKLIREMSTRDSERLQEMMDLFWSEGLNREFGERQQTNPFNLLEPNFGRTISSVNVSDPMSFAFGAAQHQQCSCKDCPYRVGADEFYRDIFSAATPGSFQPQPSPSGNNNNNIPNNPNNSNNGNVGNPNNI